MLRPLHSALGLVAALLVTVVSVSGAILAIEPAAEEAAAPRLAPGTTSVATLATDVARTFPAVRRIERRPSGAFMVTAAAEDGDGRTLYDPVTGATTAVPFSPPAMVVIKNLHRSLLLDDPGRAAAGLGSLAVLILCLSGATMLAKRLGGWRRLAGTIRGTTAQRLHASVARAMVLGLLVSAASGVVMSASTFELLPDPLPVQAGAPASPEGPTAAAGTIPALVAADATTLVSLTFPDPEDPADVFRLATLEGEVTLDRTTGAVVGRAPTTAWQAAWRLVYALHTGTYALPVTLVLALSTAAVPVMAWSGAAVWWRRRRSRPSKARGLAVQAADTVILVGSEGNGTWGFAHALADTLTAAGRRVHLAPMNALPARYRHADLLLVLTATYGDGTAPASASRFLDRLARFSPTPGQRTAVLGFGDRQFPKFCAYADEVADALAHRGLAPVCATGHVDRQSPQAFRDWCAALGRALGLDLSTDYVPGRPRTIRLVLRERRDYGAAVGAPIAVLRFVPETAAPAAGRRRRHARLPRFEAGDLVGVLPPGSDVARFYSLATSRSDGVLEICVRRQPDGQCSNHLHGLRAGDGIDAFVRTNPAFRPAPGTAPVILVGAGTGIAPLAGFIRQNASRRPMHLYLGARHPESDFLYEHDLAACLDDRRLTRLTAAFSRTVQRCHVHHRLAEDADAVRALLARGGQVVVCGGLDMARSVAGVLASVVEPLGLTVADLRRDGRYVEDVY